MNCPYCNVLCKPLGQQQQGYVCKHCTYEPMFIFPYLLNDETYVSFCSSNPRNELVFYPNTNQVFIYDIDLNVIWEGIYDQFILPGNVSEIIERILNLKAFL